MQTQKYLLTSTSEEVNAEIENEIIWNYKLNYKKIF